MLRLVTRPHQQLKQAKGADVHKQSEQTRRAQHTEKQTEDPAVLVGRRGALHVSDK